VNPFLLPPAERLSDWRLFRAAIAPMTEAQRLAAVAAYWAKAPLSIGSDLAQWPSIWQMLQTNIWSRNSVAVGMEATLRLSGTATERMTLRRIRTDQDVLLVLVIDDTWLLNYDWGSFRPYSTIDHEVICQWRFIGKDYFTLDG
jgi:hypothetical protein